MRTLKFRVWNKKTNAWVEGHGPHKENSLDGVNLFGETVLLGGFISEVSIEDLNELVAVQFTGCKDKNGKDIFEGDIITMGNKSEFIPKYGKIVYHRHMFMCDTGSGPYNIAFTEGMCNGTSEVIGNIFENSELCK